MCECESCVEFCGSSGVPSGLSGGGADGVGGHADGGGDAVCVLDVMVVGLWGVVSAASDCADPAGVDGGGLVVSVVASVEGCDGRAGGPVEFSEAEAVAGAVGAGAASRWCGGSS